MSKCQHLTNVTSQIAWNIRITCVHGRNVTNCIRMVGNGIADVITLGEEQIYQAGTCVCLESCPCARAHQYHGLLYGCVSQGLGTTESMNLIG